MKIATKRITLRFQILLQKPRRFPPRQLSGHPRPARGRDTKKDLNLIRFNFRPTNADWVELGEIALAFGKSRCWLFVHLLKLDIAGMSRLLRKAKLSFGVPTIPRLELKIFWSLQRVRENFTRGYHVKV
ncbi:MAG: DUF1564 family protein [Leptospiraceae bacterium]|nr:DUF1564 family protein [Leptospiraceae bacterium]